MSNAPDRGIQHDPVHGDFISAHSYDLARQIHEAAKSDPAIRAEVDRFIAEQQAKRDVR